MWSFPEKGMTHWKESSAEPNAEEPGLWVPCDRTCSHPCDLVCDIIPGDDVSQCTGFLTCQSGAERQDRRFLGL